MTNFAQLAQEEFDNLAVMLHEADMEIMWQKAQFAVLAEERRQRSRAGHFWFCSSRPIAKLARRARAIPEEWRLTAIDESVIDAAITCADEHRDSRKPWRHDAWRWLRVAWRCRLSARQLKDRADVGRGRKVSRVALVNHEGSPTEWEPGRIALDVPDWMPSGEPPELVRLRAVEVLQKGE